MTSHQHPVSLSLLLLLLLMLAACTAAAEPGTDPVLQIQPAADTAALAVVEDPPLPAAPTTQTDAVSGSAITFDEPDPDQPVDDGEDASDTAVVGSDGTLVNAEPVADGEVAIAGGAGEGNSPQDFESELVEAGVTWEIYRDPTFGFELTVPSSYTAAPGDGSGLLPQPVQLFAFGAAQPAAGEPPEFEIRVYDNSQGLTLSQWLAANAALTNDDSNTAVRTINGRDAHQICSQQLIAPRCATYVAGSGVIYALSGTSAFTDAIVDSFVGG